MTTSQTIYTSLATALVAIGATVLIGTTETVNVGESRITEQTEQSATVVTKTSDTNKEIKILKKQYDKTTGQETSPAVFIYNTDSLQSDIKGKQDDIVRIQAEIERVQGLIENATGSGDIVVTTDQFDPATGAKLEPLTQTYKVEEAEKQIQGGQEAITALHAQIDEMQDLIDQANKIN